MPCDPLANILTLSKKPRSPAAAAPTMFTAAPELLYMRQSLTKSWPAGLVETVRPSRIALPLPERNPMMATFSTLTVRPALILMPTKPVVAPLMERLRKLTTMVLGVAVCESLTLMPLVPAARIEANVPPPSIVMDLVVVTAPKPPGSMASISPPAAVLEIAPAKVLQGAVRLHGLTSSPTPETHVRVACACASELTVNVYITTAKTFRVKRTLFMMSSPL